MPAHHQDGSQLEAVLSFYSSIVTVNAEGDSLVSEDTLEGLGTTGFLLQTLFGSLLKVVSPDSINSVRPPPVPPPKSSPETAQEAETLRRMGAAARAVSAPYGQIADQETDGASEKLVSPIKLSKQDEIRQLSNVQEADEAVNSTLTDLLPDAGYFLAGAVSGGVSRTATAPLDRLKVYLLVNVKSNSTVVTDLAKQGHPIVAIRSSGGPIIEAVKTLWRTGGIKTFFAGKEYWNASRLTRHLLTKQS